MNPRIQRWTLSLMVILALGLSAVAFEPMAAGTKSKEDSDKPETSADKIAGRWRIKLEGLSDKHEPILASFAVEGELLVGTVSVGRKTMPVSSGRVSDTSFKLEFRHVDGDRFKMRGRAGVRGLEGTWEARDMHGKWSARRLGQ
jgi:hypothetical protein